jgi:Ni,Fe-hydrogenase III small subunit
MELGACSNVNFDMGRFGIDFVASPRHADGIVITGPISKNMAYALEDCYHSVPDPKIVILCGACAISGGVFQESTQLNREFLEKYPIDLYIPGCAILRQKQITSCPKKIIHVLLCYNFGVKNGYNKYRIFNKMS